METTATNPSRVQPVSAPDRSYVDWSAIFGGAVIVLAVGLLASGFGGALGLTAISAEPGKGSPKLALVITAIWIVLSMVCSYAAGGYVAGRMRRRIDGWTSDEVTVRDGLNGLIVWALGIFMSAWFLGSAIGASATAAGHVAATVANVGAQAAGGAAAGAVAEASSLVPNNPVTGPMSFVTGAMLRPTSVATDSANSEATAADAASILANLTATGEISDADRAYLVQLTSARAGLAEPEATQRVDTAIKAAQAARDKAEQAAQAARDAAETARISAILTAFLVTAVSLVAAVAAYAGAVRGGKHRDEGRIFGGFAYRR